MHIDTLFYILWDCKAIINCLIVGNVKLNILPKPIVECGAKINWMQAINTKSTAIARIDRMQARIHRMQAIHTEKYCNCQKNFYINRIY